MSQADIEAQRKALLELLPLQYEDGPDYCTVRDANGRDFAMTVQPELMKAMEVALRQAAKEPDELHPSHKTRISDASSFDEICVHCGATDITSGGWGRLKYPCPKAPAMPSAQSNSEAS